ncbi:MAG: DUF5011 domain-containing protein [Candidatus Izemoplasmatales bacterium]|nr:DUF5011 domain-containing protein [Candidatus Izemoplasmatales bacterium]
MKRKLFIIIPVLFTFFIFSCSIVIKDPETLNINLNPGVDTIEVNQEFKDAGATATLEGDSHPVSIIFSNVDITRVGTYEIVYQTKYNNITLETKRYVDVIDSTSPIITINPGIDTIVKNTEWIDEGVSVNDNSKLEVTITTEGYVTPSQIGEYHITYTATDIYGNESSITRFVYVIEN